MRTSGSVWRILLLKKALQWFLKHCCGVFLKSWGRGGVPIMSNKNRKHSGGFCSGTVWYRCLGRCPVENKKKVRDRSTSIHQGVCYSGGQEPTALTVNPIPKTTSAPQAVRTAAHVCPKESEEMVSPQAWVSDLFGLAFCHPYHGPKAMSSQGDEKLCPQGMQVGIAFVDDSLAFESEV